MSRLFVDYADGLRRSKDVSPLYVRVREPYDFGEVNQPRMNGASHKWKMRRASMNRFLSLFHQLWHAHITQKVIGKENHNHSVHESASSPKFSWNWKLNRNKVSKRDRNRFDPIIGHKIKLSRSFERERPWNCKTIIFFSNFQWVCRDNTNYHGVHIKDLFIRIWNCCLYTKSKYPTLNQW